MTEAWKSLPHSVNRKHSSQIQKQHVTWSVNVPASLFPSAIFFFIRNHIGLDSTGFSVDLQKMVFPLSTKKAMLVIMAPAWTTAMEDDECNRQWNWARLSETPLLPLR